MINMPVTSATAGYGNAAYHSNPQTTDNFDDILQQQIENTTEAEPKALEVIVRYDRPVKLSYFEDDPELEAYVKQFALENGIEKLDFGRRMEFEYLISELLDQGLISRQDVIDAVKFPPQIDRHGDDIHATLDWSGFGKSRKGIELAFATPMDLFEMLWE